MTMVNATIPKIIKAKFVLGSGQAEQTFFEFKEKPSRHTVQRGPRYPSRQEALTPPLNKRELIVWKLKSYRHENENSSQ